jgi:hypothetical protein
MAAGLFAACALAQSTGSNVVPKQAIQGAVRRALLSPNPPVVKRQLQRFRIPAARLAMAHDCAIPLRQTPGTDTGDQMAREGISLDLKMAMTPRVPACPGQASAHKRP